MNLEYALFQWTKNTSQFMTRVDATLKNREKIMQSQTTLIKNLEI